MNFQSKEHASSSAHTSKNQVSDLQKHKSGESQNQDQVSSPDRDNKKQELANQSSQVTQLKALQELANHSPQVVSNIQLMASTKSGSKQKEMEAPLSETPTLPTHSAPIQRASSAPNNGLPSPLKSGIESLSGLNMDDVEVHRNSEKPAQLQAHAYAQGSNIFLGAGQEKHLPHEAWHVVQQKQNRVKPTLQMKGRVKINDDQGLETEADFMGAKANRLGKTTSSYQAPATPLSGNTPTPSKRFSQAHQPKQFESGTPVVQRVAHGTNFHDKLTATRPTVVLATDPKFIKARAIAFILDHNLYEREPSMQYTFIQSADAAIQADVTSMIDMSPKELMAGFQGALKSLMAAGGGDPTTLSTMKWGPVTPWGAGTGVQVRLRQGGHADGSDAGGDPEWMLQLEERSDGRTLYVRGHLLNRHLGGPGLDWNMVPLTGKPAAAFGGNDANGIHSGIVEEIVKKMYEKVDNGRDDEVTGLIYQVVAVPRTAPRPQTTKVDEITTAFEILIQNWLTYNRGRDTHYSAATSRTQATDSTTGAPLFYASGAPIMVPTVTDDAVRGELLRRIKATTHLAPEAELQVTQQLTDTNREDLEVQLGFIIDRAGPRITDLSEGLDDVPFPGGVTGISSMSSSERDAIVLQIRTVKYLETVLNAITNAPWRNYSLFSLQAFMRSNRNLWQLEDRMVPEALEVKAQWTQFETTEKIKQRIPVRLPSSLSAPYRSRS